MLYTVFLFLILLYAFVVLFVIVSSFVSFLITRVPFVRTSTSDIKFIVNKLNIKSTDYFWDLGSGDGRVCFIVNKLTQVKCKGFELTLWTYLLSQIKRYIFKKTKQIEFLNQNFFSENWAEATHIYAYLYPSLMKGVQEKFLTECKPGSQAIIRDFPLPDLKPTQVFYLPKDHEIYLYKK